MERDIVFVDATGRPWRIAPFDLQHQSAEEASQWIWYWSTYNKWTPLRAAGAADFAEAVKRPKLTQWEADLYHKLSEIYS